jgi:hypothetical protein
MVLCFLGYGVFMLGVYILITHAYTGGDVDSTAEEEEGFDFRDIITLSKIMVGLWQILCGLEVSIDMPYPESFQWFVSIIKPFSMDVVAMFDMGCIVEEFTFYDKFTFALFLPMVMGLVCMVSYYWLDIHHGAARARSITIQMGLFVAFMTYPFVSQTIFSGFNCRRLSDYEAWLSVDYQISCSTVGHVVYIAVATMAVAIYPIGVPLGILFLLVKNRKEMHVENSPARLRYAFLVTDYKPQYYFWETLEMLRKVHCFSVVCKSFVLVLCIVFLISLLHMYLQVILVGLLIFLPPGSIRQLVVAILVTFTFLVAGARHMPYKDLNANRFKLATDSALTLTLVFALLLKVDLSKEDTDEFEIGLFMLAFNIVIPALTLTISAYLTRPVGQTKAGLSEEKIGGEQKSEGSDPTDPTDGDGVPQGSGDVQNQPPEIVESEETNNPLVGSLGANDSEHQNQEPQNQSVEPTPPIFESEASEETDNPLHGTLGVE